MKKIIILLLVCLPVLLHARKQGQARMDSLISELNSENYRNREDSAKVKLLNEIAMSYSSINPDEGIKYGKQSIELAQNINWSKGISLANFALGINYGSGADYPKALEYDFIALKLADELKNKRLQEQYLGEIGYIYYMLKDYDKGLDYYDRALKIAARTNDERDSAKYLTGISSCYLMQGEYFAAMDYNSQALKVVKNLGDKASVANTQLSGGIIIRNLKNITKALEYFNKSLALYQEMDDKNGIASSLANIGECYFILATDTTKLNTLGLKEQSRKANLNEAISYLTRAIAIFKATGSLDHLQSYARLLSEAYELVGNYKDALESYKLYTVFTDSVFSNENIKKIAKLEGKHDAELKEKQIEVQRLQIKQAKKERIYYLAGLGLLVLFSIVLFNRFRIIRKNKTQLEEKNLLIAAEKENADKLRMRAEQSEQFKQKFLANMSHEIRTPMNAVLGMTNLTLDTPLTTKQEKYLTAVKKSSENLLVIINDVLDLSKLEAGKMELENIPFRIEEQISQVYDTMQFKAEEKGLMLRTEVAKDIPAVLTGDPSRLNQVLINLCGNAIKFTGKGTVRLVVEKVSGTEATIRFRVIDSGIGIPADKIGKLFESFQQVDASTSRKYGGTGLGLSISKTLVEMQGGKMVVKSEEGTGSEFSFTITYGVADEKAITEANANNKVSPALLMGIYILVAEDNDYNQVVIKDTLENLIRDVKVDIAENGKIAVEKHTANSYDLILMDAHMPEMSGLEATEYIRKKMESPKKDIPIIALTASVIEANLEKCYQAGMNAHVPKPFRREELLNALGKYYKNEKGLEIEKKDEKGQPEVTKTEPVATDTGPSEKITNLTYLSEFCEQDKTRMKKYIDIYLRVTPVNLTKINEALGKEEYLYLSQTVHAMKPHLNFMGMKPTRAVAEKIELYASELSNIEELPGLISKLQYDCEKSLGELSPK